MASANVELVRSILAAWERGDFGGAAWADPEIEYVFADGPSPGTWVGFDGMARGWREFLNAWEELRIDAHDFRELDDEQVLVFYGFSGRGKSSGLRLEEMRTEGAGVFHFRAGMVVRIVAYWNLDHALDDLGLSPDVD